MWVKPHDIPIVAFTENKISAMATRLDIMDDRGLKDTMVIVVPCLEGNGDVLHNVRVEYEWKPPRCGICMVFGHDEDLGPKHIIIDMKKQIMKTNDGFQAALRKASRGLSVGLVTSGGNVIEADIELNMAQTVAPSVNRVTKREVWIVILRKHIMLLLNLWLRLQNGPVVHGGSKQVGLKQLGSKQVGFKQLGHKQVGFKQLGPGVETRVHEVSNDDDVVAQKWLEDKQLEENTNTDCLVKEQEKVHLGIKVEANITVTGVPGQEGAENNVSENKKVKESMEANLGK
nr:zinc knuckle CX2CX4HX4C [Tanacetum cinerariifolium]